MKLVYNGELLDANQIQIAYNNRGLNYGDALFETIRTLGDKILFWEDHYFRLMASMRILRMSIPMEFTPDFLENKMKELIASQGNKDTSYAIKILVWREANGKYTPDTNTDIGYQISINPLDSFSFEFNNSDYELSLYRDFAVQTSMLSNLKTSNRIINVLGGIYAKENDFDNCVLLNNEKFVAEALNANIFLVKGYKIYTPKLESGCIDGIMRKQIIKILTYWPDYILEEKDITSFDLQKADEVFLTNSIIGIQAVSQFRKANYKNDVSKLFYEKLLEHIA